MRRLGWYPGDWIWVGLPTLLVAAAGAAVAIALTTDDGSAKGGTTIVASTSRLARNVATPAPPPPAALPSAPEPSAGGTTKTSTTPSGTSNARNGQVSWPSTRDGWTIVLVSYPLARGRGAPLATAKRAAGLGLPEVGVLESSDFSSLHPGYSIVFSGIYSSRADAEAALTSARATGFGTAYTREISR
jgi:hypothetical protein